MTDGLKASQIKGGIRPSKSFDPVSYTHLTLPTRTLV